MNKKIILASALICSTLASQAFAAKYKVIDVIDGGSISGTVNFKGDDPEPTIYAITKDNDTCGNGNRFIDYVKVNNGKLNDVVVYLDKVKKGKDFVAEEANIGLDQKGCEFSPYISVMHNKAKLSATNSDPVLHNLHTYEIIGRAKKTVLNVSQPDQGNTYTSSIKLKRGVAMKVECDAHDFMHGFVFVAKNPYYAMVDANGNYKIENIPAGKYKIKAFHGALKNQKGKVTVSKGANATVDFTFK